ncbi:MAG: UDP-N-acetylglucosamine diphosphorylase [Chlamydiales bacterium]|nr:UDP-N-acetylglucosamine diphosphorylase [Chlamydiia bacterium]MCP5507456.1 UDP-N-acetylglucosamine diphosphorylase [Chlamydiales bacterium]
MSQYSPDNLFDLKGFEHKSVFDNCSYAWEVLPKISDYLSNYPLGKIECDIPDGVIIIDPHLVSIGTETVLEPGSYIKGPCIIGKGCFVRHGAYIRGNLIAGDRCVIGHTTEVKNCIMMNHAQAAHFAYLGDSVLGNNVNLGAGTKCANLKLDNRSVSVYLNGERVDTGLRKFGAILGDSVQTGCNCVTNPGTIMGKGACCYPCTNFGGYIPPGEIVKGNTILKKVQ